MKKKKNKKRNILALLAKLRKGGPIKSKKDKQKNNDSWEDSLDKEYGD